MTGVDLPILLPEILLALYAMAALLVWIYGGKDKWAGALTWTTAAVLVAVALIVATKNGLGSIAFGGMFVDDAFSRFAKVTILLSAAVVLVMGRDHAAQRGLGQFEYPILATLAVIGMMAMVSSGDLMTLYMGLELQSLASWRPCAGIR